MRLPRGLTKTAKGWRISLKIGAKLWQRRLPVSLDEEDAIAELLKLRKTRKAGTTQHPTGTLRGDVTHYLAAYMTGHPAHHERQRHLELWITELGESAWRGRINKDDVARVLNQWKASGLAADTCNKRRAALSALYNALDGRGGKNPVRDVPKFRAPEPLPRGIPYALIRRALKKLPKSRTRARLAVMAYTGLRQGQVMKLTPEAWDEKAHILLVPGTAKGRGTKPYTIPLSPAAEDALREFEDLDAWGRFQTAPMARMWREASAKAKLPKGTVPYDLRHSFGTAIYKATGDIKATKALMGHAAIRMTERYMLAAVPERQQKAIAATFKKQRYE